MAADQHDLIAEDGRIIFYAHHLSDENRQKVANVKAVYEENERLKARIAELEAEQKWQPIETVRKDGSLVVLADGSRTFLVKWLKNAKRWAQPSGSILPGMFTPTHWKPMPLPKMTTPETPSG